MSEVARGRTGNRARAHPPMRYWAIRLVFAGLVVALVSLTMLHHPMGFLTFAIGACSLLGLGIVCYVVSLFREGRAST